MKNVSYKHWLQSTVMLPLHVLITLVAPINSQPHDLIGTSLISRVVSIIEMGIKLREKLMFSPKHQQVIGKTKSYERFSFSKLYL